MNDLISRDKAIAETWRETSYSDPANVLTEIRDRLNALPSEESKIVRCKDCKYWTHIKRTNRYWCKTDDGLFDLNPLPDDFCSRAKRRIESDLIYRQEAVKMMYDACEDIDDESLHIDVIVDALENLPSAEPRKKGKWIKVMEGNAYRDKCNQCGRLYPNAYGYNLCPNCGADMRGGKR